MGKSCDFVDLHMHSTFSDGTNSPAELLEFIMETNINTFSLTDHDTIDGNAVLEKIIKEKQYNINFIAGVELGTFIKYKGKSYNTHILGYNIIDTNKELNDKLEFLRNQRSTRFKKMVDKVNLLGYNIDFKNINNLSMKKSLGRPLLAEKLCSLGYFKNVQEVFNELLAEGKPGYVPQEKLSPAEAIRLIKESKGVAVLAHPAELKNDDLVKKILKEENFDGVEIWHPSANEKKIKTYLEFANEYNLYVTGGSDFHGTKGRFPEKLGEFCVEYKKVSKFINKLKSNN